MAQTPEERKIKRLEKQVADLKIELSEQKRIARNQERALSCEREWRQQFQSLMKCVIQANDLSDYEKEYW